MKTNLFSTALFSVLWIIAEAGSSAANLRPVAYVSNRGDDTVSMISLETLRVIDTIAVGDEPVSPVLAPDGSRLYVVNVASRNVSVIDTRARTVIATIPVGASSNAPSTLTVSPNGRRVYVANSESSTISVIDAASNTLEDTIPTRDYPTAIAHHPTRDELWLGFGVHDTQGTIVLAVISTIDYSMLATATSGFYLYGGGGLQFTPDGSQLYGTEACGCCGRFHRISGTHTNGNIIIVDPGLFEGGGWAVGVAVHPSNGTAYFAQQGHCFDPPLPRISELGGADRVLSLSTAPTAIGITPDGNRLCIVQGTSMQVRDLASFAVVTNVTVGANPTGIALGLVPADPTLSISVAAVQMCWDSVLGAVYQLEYKSNLTTNTWQPLAPTVTGDGSTNCVTDVTQGNPSRFYRIRVLEW